MFRDVFNTSDCNFITTGVYLRYEVHVSDFSLIYFFSSSTDSKYVDVEKQRLSIWCL